MRDKNRVELRGRLGADPVLSTTETGRSRASIRLCTNYEYTSNEGKEVKVSEWHTVVVWGKAAENAAKYLAKGSEAEIEGRLQSRKYTDKTGVERYTTEIVANEINYGRRPTVKTEEAAPAAQVTPVQRTTVRTKANTVTASSNFQSDDEIPF
jgi:single-strand DNA-binding protein